MIKKLPKLSQPAHLPALSNLKYPDWARKFPFASFLVLICYIFIYLFALLLKHINYEKNTLTDIGK